MFAIKDHYIVYNDNTFNCPDCHCVHFEKDWRPYYVKDGEKFKFRCVNSQICDHTLIAFVKEGLIYVTTYKIEKFVYRKKNKIKTMKRITDIQAHVNRYADVHINDKVKLVAALQQSIDDDRKALIEKMKLHQEQLQNGIIPEDEPAKNKRTRKAKEQHTDAQGNDTFTQDNGIDDVVTSDEL